MMTCTKVASSYLHFDQSDNNQSIAYTDRMVGSKLGHKTSALISLREVIGNSEPGILRLCFKNKTFHDGNLLVQSILLIIVHLLYVDGQKHSSKLLLLRTLNNSDMIRNSD